MLELLKAKGKYCTGCGACYNICPKDAIHMEPDSEGFLVPLVDEEQCIHCGLCEKTCPVGASSRNSGWKMPCTRSCGNIRQRSMWSIGSAVYAARRHWSGMKSARNWKNSVFVKRRPRHCELLKIPGVSASAVPSPGCRAKFAEVSVALKKTAGSTPFVILVKRLKENSITERQELC